MQRGKNSTATTEDQPGIQCCQPEQTDRFFKTKQYPGFKATGGSVCYYQFPGGKYQEITGKYRGQGYLYSNPATADGPERFPEHGFGNEPERCHWQSQ